MKRKLRLVLPVLAIIAIMAGAAPVASAKDNAQLTGVVNINTATADELMLLPGIGPAKANAIIALRSAESFKGTEDLLKVKGIGDKLYEKIKGFVTVDGPTTAKSASADVSVN
jgi:competence protein ComEA